MPFDVAAWREAMKSVPAGPWQMKDFDVELSVSTMDGSAPLIADLVEQGDAREPGHWGSEYQIGQWLARCSPAGISTLLCEIERLQALENSKALLADATNDPASLSSLRKGAEVGQVVIDRDLVERAQHQLLASPFPFDRCVAAEISAALVSGSREEG